MKRKEEGGTSVAAARRMPLVCQHGTAVTAAEVALLFKNIKVTPDGGLAGVQPAAEVGNPHETLRFQNFQYFKMPLIFQHGRFLRKMIESDRL